MSVYVAFDETEAEFLASNKGWSEFSRWAESGGDHLSALVADGWTEPANDLWEEMRDGETPTDENVKGTFDILFNLLASADDDAPVLITNGVVPEREDNLSFDAADHPRGHEGNPGQFAKKGEHATPKSESDLHSQAEPSAEKVVANAEKSGLWAKIKGAGKWLRDKSKAIYTKLEARYGRGQAIAIFAAGHIVGLATPAVVLPGSTMLSMLPFAALAETYLQARRGLKAIGLSQEPLSMEEVMKLGAQLAEQLQTEWADYLKENPVNLSVDASGHEHKGKGEGGGQFTSVPGGSGETSKPGLMSKKADKRENGAGSTSFTDDDIDESQIGRTSSDHLADWNFVDGSDNFPQSVRLEYADYDTDPDGDDPDSIVTVYRWISRDDGGGYVSSRGEWTLDEDKAREDGKQHAEDNHEEEVEPEEEQEDEEPEEEDDEESQDELDEWLSKAAPLKKREVSLGEAKLPKSEATARVKNAVEKHADKILKTVFGAEDDGENYDALCACLGMPDDADILIEEAGKLSAKFSDDLPLDAVGVRVKITHPKMERAIRFIGVDADGKRFIRNEVIELKQKYQGEGLGIDIFTKQVESAAEHGFDYIQTHAARDNNLNGYATWPKFGYDQQLDDPIERSEKRGTKVVYEQARQLFPNAKSVLDILETKEGEQWWCGKKNPDGTRTLGNGTDMHNARFDLQEESRSMQVLKAYARKKKAATISRLPQNNKTPLMQPGTSGVESFRRRGHERKKLESNLKKQPHEMIHMSQPITLAMSDTDSIIAKAEAAGLIIADEVKDKIRSAVSKKNYRRTSLPDE